jgi:hypothetical protein
MAGMERAFTVAEARCLLGPLRQHVEQLITLRADLADARTALQRGEAPTIGGLPEVKALEARLQEAVDWFGQHGIQLKGLAPVIVDFPSFVEGEPVLLCWLEGEESLGWYHDAEAGFMGRRRLPDVG